MVSHRVDRMITCVAHYQLGQDVLSCVQLMELSCVCYGSSVGASAEFVCSTQLIMPPTVIQVIGKANGKAKATPQANAQAKVQAKTNAKGINTNQDLRSRLTKHAPQ